jgi:hypothetical protein
MSVFDEHLFGRMWDMVVTGPTPELVALEAAVEACLMAAADPERSRDDLGADLCLTRVLINRLELVFARGSARFAADWDVRYHDTPNDWIRMECHMTSHAVSTALTVGEEEAQLPQSIDAFLDGRIGIAHLGLLAEVAEFAVTRPIPLPFDETALLAKAQHKNVYRFRQDCYHAEHALDAAACVAATAGDVDFRRLRLRPGGSGGLFLAGYLDAEGGALLRTALEPLARKSGADENRSRAQRLGDALVELAGHRLDHGQIPARASQRSHLQVTTTLETLLGVAGAPGAELGDGGLIPDASVQRLACDATITRVLLNAESMVVDVGRSQRVVPGATRRALNVRDKGCRWPGCPFGASWTQAHHVVHWVRGGRTDLDNLVLLCRKHHTFVHERGHQILRLDGGEILTIPPGPHHDFQARPPNRLAA